MTRSCVVTGGAGGIGNAIAQELRTAGWHVVTVDIAGSPHVEGHVVGDVADPSTHQRAAQAAEALAPLGGWVNCAGYNILGAVTEVTEAELRHGTDVNLLGVFHGTAEACRRLVEADRPGAIVNISSIQAAVGFPGFAAYAMTKGGIEALSRQVAAEYIARGIRCNVVAPGLIHSEMNDRLLAASAHPETLSAQWAQLTPMGRWGQPKDVAAAVSFLLGPTSSYITGEVLAVNGGALTIARGHG
ncbi:MULTISPECIES: SDR family oxidoreductase [Microbacterium]|uniref:SDR family NAD(P)-dependent oxidoreductase n=1 Tax=Microbacterium TaxID=33882 RepID=UPI00146E8C1F|nr:MULTISPECIES: SDR family oxidoreductase [Microbacterium]